MTAYQAFIKMLECKTQKEWEKVVEKELKEATK